MNLHKLIFTNNDCYKAGKTMTPKGIMVHSTGANNPNLKRYVGPDDGLLGVNQYGNHWNQHMDRQVCVHAFIGKLNGNNDTSDNKPLYGSAHKRYTQTSCRWLCPCFHRQRRTTDQLRGAGRLLHQLHQSPRRLGVH